MIKNSALAMLTPEEIYKLNEISSSFENIFNKFMKENGIEDMAIVFAHLLGKMIDYSCGEVKKTPDEFKNVLRYHFGEQGGKYHGILIKLFNAVFASFGRTDAMLVQVSVQLLIAKLLEGEAPENVKIEGDALYIRKKRRF